jgi:protein O-GlcNAc transferase
MASGIKHGTAGQAAVEAKPRTRGALSRNGRCLCGSGRKYKQCCLEALPRSLAPDSKPGKVSSRTPEASAALLQPTTDPPEPARADELHNLGVAALREGQFERAVELISQAIELEGAAADYYLDLAAAIQGLGDLTVTSAKSLHRLWPNDWQIQKMVADALFHWGDHLAALEAYRAALRIRPADGSSLNSLAFILGEIGDNGAAVVAYREGLALDPSNSALYHNLGDCLRLLGRLDEAIVALEEAVRLAPESMKSLLNLAHLQQILCQWQGLEGRWKSIRSILALDADSNASVRTGEPDGDAHLPGSDLSGPFGTDAEGCSGAGCTDTALNPFFFLSVPGTPAEQLACARAWSNERYSALPTDRHALRSMRQLKSHERLHIGYISSDFRDHAVARLIAEVFELHDRSRFAISAYSIGPDDQSPLRQRIVRSMDRFIDLSQASHAEAAQKIRADSVDILVDLNGHTAMNRADILALRPADIQVSYWGFPGTTGAPYIDYAIVDRFVVPPQQQVFFSERLAYLPHCYMPNDRKRRIAAGPLQRERCGLPAAGFVFCAFNHPAKITPDMFATWMRVLAATPDSVLWLLETNRWASDNLRGEALRAGIDQQRLIFAPMQPLHDHLARHRLADLFLDTLPYNGHTTTCDALWVGLPVLTCAGETFASRVAGSALYAAGLPELVTTSLTAYEALAVSLARDPARLQTLRERLAHDHEVAPLFDCTIYTRNLEALYRRMWEELCRAGEYWASDRTPIDVRTDATLA